jgi:hypothetical protein
MVKIEAAAKDNRGEYFLEKRGKVMSQKIGRIKIKVEMSECNPIRISERGVPPK